MSALRMAAVGTFMAAALTACNTAPTAETKAGASSGTSLAPQAVATLEPTKGNSAAGRVSFRQQGDKVLVSATLKGLKPNQEHGFHVHEKGDCSSGDGMSTGGHFNPTGKPHGAPEGEHHAGDMPAVKSDASGNADVSFTLSGVVVNGGATGLVGHGLILHAAPDDYKTQPTGNSGARIACGVIKAA